MVSIFPGSAPFPDTMDTMSEFQNPWPAPLATRPLSATVTIPGSKSLSNRYLILAAMGQHPVTLVGLLRSRDTNLMMGALRSLGVEFHVDPDDDGSSPDWRCSPTGRCGSTATHRPMRVR